MIDFIIESFVVFCLSDYLGGLLSSLMDLTYQAVPLLEHPVVFLYNRILYYYTLIYKAISDKREK